jgi:hypothetical protein
LNQMNIATRDPDPVTNGNTALQVAEQPLVVLPVTGEQIDLRDPAQVAGGLDQVRDLEQRLRALRHLLSDVLRLESTRRGTKTLHLDGNWTAVVSGGSRPEYDTELLARRLQSAGLPEERLADLVKAVITYKVDAQIARQLSGANPAYAAALREARTDVPAPWRVAVTRIVRKRGEPDE